jgi:hypothetical protein
MLLLSSEVQRREPSLVGKVYIGAVLQVCGHASDPAFESGVVQRRAAGSVYFGSHARSMHYPGYGGLATRVHNHTVIAASRSPKGLCPQGPAAALQAGARQAIKKTSGAVKLHSRPGATPSPTAP